MRSKVLWILMVASLALNVFFVAGFAYTRLVGHHHPPHRFDPVAKAAEEFSLDERQTEALVALRGRMAERLQEGRKDRGGFQAAIIDALSKPAFDRVALAQALEAERAKGGDMILDMTEQVHGFLAGLSPEQKEAFLKRARERDFLRRLLFPPSDRRRDGPPPERD